MKNKFFIPIILVIFAWGIFVYIDRKKVQKKSDVVTLSWSHFRKDKLTKIISTVYQESKELSYSLEKEQGFWVLTDPIQMSIFQEKAIILANGFLTLTPQKVLSNITAADLETYGLSTPSFKITGILDNQTNGFIIGEKTSIGNQYYIRDVRNTNFVYLVNQSMIDPFTQGISSIVNNYFVTKSTDDIVMVSFYNTAKEKIVLTNRESFWVQVEPEENTQVDWGTRKFLLGLRDLTFDAKTASFDVSEDMFRRLGIDRTESPQISLVFNDNTTNTLIVGSSNIQGAYPIYISYEKLVAYSSQEIIDMVFNTIVSDFQNQRRSD